MRTQKKVQPYTEKSIFLDIGGGTSDISVMQRSVTNREEWPRFQVRNEIVGLHGDRELGGIDITNQGIKMVEEQLYKDSGGKLPRDLSPGDYSKIYEAVEDAKKVLTSQEFAYIEVTIQAKDYSIMLDKNEWEKRCTDFKEKMRKIINEALEEAKTTPDEIKSCVFVGGTTKVWFWKKFISELFHTSKILNKYSGDEIVAHGAAIFCALRVYGLDWIGITRVLSASLGVALEGNKFKAIIPKLSPLPIRKTDTFPNHKDDLTTGFVEVYEGTSPKTNENTKLGHCEVTNCKTPRTTITYQVDVDGIVTVTAHEEDNLSNFVTMTLETGSGGAVSKKQRDKIKEKQVQQEKAYEDEIRKRQKAYDEEMQRREKERTQKIEIIRQLAKMIKQFDDEYPNNVITKKYSKLVNKPESESTLNDIMGQKEEFDNMKEEITQRKIKLSEITEKIDAIRNQVHETQQSKFQELESKLTNISIVDTEVETLKNAVSEFIKLNDRISKIFKKFDIVKTYSYNDDKLTRELIKMTVETEQTLRDMLTTGDIDIDMIDKHDVNVDGLLQDIKTAANGTKKNKKTPQSMSKDDQSSKITQILPDKTQTLHRQPKQPPETTGTTLTKPQEVSKQCKDNQLSKKQKRSGQSGQSGKSGQSGQSGQSKRCEQTEKTKNPQQSLIGNDRKRKHNGDMKTNITEPPKKKQRLNTTSDTNNN